MNEMDEMDEINEYIFNFGLDVDYPFNNEKSFNNETYDSYKNNDDDDDLDILKMCGEEDTDEENIKLDIFTNIKWMIDKNGVDKTRKIFERMGQLEDGFTPWPPHVEYDELLFDLLKTKFFEFFPMCRNIYERNDGRFTFVKKNGKKCYSVENIPCFNYGVFKMFLSNEISSYEQNKNELLDFNMFFNFIKWVFLCTFKVGIKEYFAQLVPEKKQILFEADISNCLPRNVGKSKNRVYVLNLFNNLRTNLSRLKDLQKFKVLGYVYVKYPNFKFKKKNIIWVFGKQISKIDKKDIIFVFLKKKGFK